VDAGSGADGGAATTRDRILARLAAVAGAPRIATARRVLDRFGAADGGLLAAGVAYNAVLALVPIGLVGSGIAGFVLTDPASRADMVRALSAFLPPLAGVVDDVVGGLAKVSPTLSLVGLVLAAWGTTRLYAALESAIVQLDSGGLRRGLVRRTVRRLAAIAVVALVLLAALIVGPALAVATEVVGTGGVQRTLLDALFALVPPVVAGVALAAIYRLIPVVRPSWRAISVPAVGGAVALVALTRAFVFVTPRVFGANVVYGTLGAILVGLAWLDLVATVILVGAAWVDERRSGEPVGPRRVRGAAASHRRP
jgi:membrane protein